MEQFNIVLSREIIFFTTMAVGFLAFRTGLLKPGILDALSDLFTKITLPFLIFVNAVEGSTREHLFSSLYVLALHLCVFAALTLGSMALAKLCGIKGSSGRIFVLGSSIGNMGFVGIPLALSLFGQEAMVYVALISLIDQVIVWTHGVALATNANAGEKPRFEAKRLLSPPLAATVLALIFIIAEIKLPRDLMAAFNELSDASLPLPFLYIGGMLAMSDIPALFRKWPVYLFVGAKMLVFPVVVFVVLSAMLLPEDVVSLYVIVAGLPALAVGPMLARMGGSDVPMATAMTSISTVASLFCVPAVTYICSVIL